MMSDTVLLALALLLAVFASVSIRVVAEAARDAGRLRFPVVTALAVALVLAGSCVQAADPSALAQFQRDPGAVAHGELWRLVTALVFQDGGRAGAVVNLVALALIGTAAEQLWTRGVWVALWLGGGLLAELAGLALGSTGAGNSVANFSLASGLVLSSLRQRRGPGRWAMGVVGVASTLTLWAALDLHGVAVVIGAAVFWGGRAMGLVKPRRA